MKHFFRHNFVRLAPFSIIFYMLLLSPFCLRPDFSTFRTPESLLYRFPSYYWLYLVVFLTSVSFAYLMSRNRKFQKLADIFLLLAAVYVLGSGLGGSYAARFAVPPSVALRATEQDGLHAAATRYVIEHGSTDPSVFYHETPLTSVWGAIVYKVILGAGFDIYALEYIMYFLSFFLQMTLILALYLIGNKLFHHGFLFTLVFLVGNLFNETRYAPQAFAISLLMLSIYLVTRVYIKADQSRTHTVLLIMFSVGMILSHSLVPVFFSVILIAFKLGNIIFAREKDDPRLSFSFPDWTIIIMVVLLISSWWAFNTKNLENIVYLARGEYGFYSELSIQVKNALLGAQQTGPGPFLDPLIRFSRLFTVCFNVVLLSVSLAGLFILFRKRTIQPETSVIKIFFLCCIGFFLLTPIMMHVYVSRIINHSYPFIISFFMYGIISIMHLHTSARAQHSGRVNISIDEPKKKFRTALVVIVMVILVFPSFLSFNSGSMTPTTSSYMYGVKFVIQHYNYRGDIIPIAGLHKLYQNYRYLSPSAVTKNMYSVQDDGWFYYHNLTEAKDFISGLYNRSNIIVRSFTDLEIFYAVYGAEYQDFWRDMDAYLGAMKYNRVYDDSFIQVYSAH